MHTENHKWISVLRVGFEPTKPVFELAKGISYLRQSGHCDRHDKHHHRKLNKHKHKHMQTQTLTYTNTRTKTHTRSRGDDEAIIGNKKKDSSSPGCGSFVVSITTYSSWNFREAITHKLSNRIFYFFIPLHSLGAVFKLHVDCQCANMSLCYKCYF
jgi:hypothetical protein